MKFNKLNYFMENINSIIERCINNKPLSHHESMRLLELINKSRAGYHLPLDRRQQIKIKDNFSSYDCIRDPKATLSFLKEQDNPIIVDFALNYPNLGSHFGLTGNEEEYLEVLNNPIVLDVVLNGPIFYDREQGIAPIGNIEGKQNIIKSIALKSKKEFEEGKVGPYTNLFLNTINAQDSVESFGAITLDDFNVLYSLISKIKLNEPQLEALEKMRLFLHIKSIIESPVNQINTQQDAMEYLCEKSPNIILRFQNKTKKGEEFCKNNIISQQAYQTLNSFKNSVIKENKPLFIAINNSIKQLETSHSSDKIKEEERYVLKKNMSSDLLEITRSLENVLTTEEIKQITY